MAALVVLFFFLGLLREPTRKFLKGFGRQSRTFLKRPSLGKQRFTYGVVGEGFLLRTFVRKVCGKFAEICKNVFYCVKRKFWEN